MRIEDGAPDQRLQNLGKKQIRNRTQLIPGRRVPRHIHAEAAQLLNQPPHLGAVRRNLLRDLRSTHYHRRVFCQQAQDAAQANIRGLVLRSGRSLRQGYGRAGVPRLTRVNCGLLLDAGIMRHKIQNHKPYAGSSRLNVAQTLSCHFADGRKLTARCTYAGITRRLMSTAWGEWVTTPTEIKSTPVSA